MTSATVREAKPFETTERFWTSANGLAVMAASAGAIGPAAQSGLPVLMPALECRIMAASSLDRVRAALARAGHPDTITKFSEGAHTAAEAAAALGCDIAAIAKSIVFRREDNAVVVIASGVNRIDTARVAALIGGSVKRADAAFIRDTTGFAIGGVAPIGHLSPPVLLLDEDLLALDPVWAGAGSPAHIFRTSGATLARLTGALVAAVRED